MRSLVLLGSLYSFARNHNSNQSTDQDPASMGPMVQAAAVNALNKRYTLLPYLYTLFYFASHSGHPVLRSLTYNFPNDSETLHVEQQFMWGECLLISPVLEPDTTQVEAYFPSGVWYEFPNGVPLTNGTGARVNLDVPVTEINVAVRGGCILPTIPSVNMTTKEQRKQPFSLIVALSSDRPTLGDLYWDDGETMNAERDPGKHSLVHFQVQDSVLRIKPQSAAYIGESGNKLAQVDVWGVEQKAKSVVMRSPTVLEQQLVFRMDGQRMTIEMPRGTRVTDDLEVEWISG